MTLRDLDRFPAHQYATAASYLSGYRDESAQALASVDQESLERAAALLLAAYVEGRMVFSCGNGGSAAISNHLQCDHVKGVRTSSDLTPRVMSLSSNIELITAIANDLSYDDVFVYQLQSQAKLGDVLLAISSSGRSPNIVRALEWARANGIHTIAMTGFTGGDAREAAEVAVHVDSANYGVVEDAHQSLMHVLAQYIRQSRMTPEAVSTSTF
jgi:D-sedoheptulose 7-phosphate isomerase/D-glycero-D-manno-heptose 1,7-bisphosphate phosphatase